MISNTAMYDGSTAVRSIPPVGDADEVYRFAYDHSNDCRRRISAILARSPMLRTSEDEDKPLPPFDLWVILHKGGKPDIPIDPIAETMAALDAEGIC